MKIDMLRNHPISFIYYWNKYYRIPKGKSQMDNPEKLATYSTKDEDNQETRHVPSAVKQNIVFINYS